MWRTGHSLIKARMKETGALLAGEMSGHIFFAEDWYGFDDATLAAARLLAGHGLRILMHGGPAHTPQRRYSDDMLAELGVALPGSVNEAGDQLRDDGFTFLDLKHFCAPLGPLLMMRFELGLRSPINTLARSLNPAGAPLSMQSVGSRLKSRAVLYVWGSMGSLSS